MRKDTFHRWLEARGCTFEQTERGGGRGHTELVARREGKRATMPAAGATEDLDPREVMRVVQALGLDWSDLPGPSSRT